MPSHNTDLNYAPQVNIEYELSEVSELDRATDEAAAVKIVLGQPLDPATVKRRGSERTPLVIVGYDQRAIVKTLRQQRANATTALRPVAIVGTSPDDAMPILKQLADTIVGPRASSEALEALRDQLLQIMGSVDNLAPAHDDPAMLMLQYLHTRGNELRPLVDASAHFAYRYPLAEHILTTSSAEALDVLQDLAEHELLTARPVDRLFLCPECGGYRVPVKELCPECQTPNVGMQDSIHHFRCGFVGPESEFIVSGRPTCPKCHSELRHIGVEYNRPGRIVTCHECGHWASEPHLRAWCVDCNVYHAPEELRAVRISRFTLTRAGARAAQLGRWNPYHTHVLPAEAQAEATAASSEAPQETSQHYLQARNILRALIDIASENDWPMSVYRADVMMSLADTPTGEQRDQVIQHAEQQIRKSLGAKDVVARINPGTFLILATKDRRKGGAPDARQLEQRIDPPQQARVQITALSPGAAADMFGMQD